MSWTRLRGAESRGWVEPFVNPHACGDEPARERRRRCFLCVAHPDRGLTRALLEHLEVEVPTLEFTVGEHEPLDAVWVCGFDPGQAPLVRRLRVRHPDAVVLVTHTGPDHGWVREAERAGADQALSWPVDYDHLTEVLCGRASRRR